MSHQWRKVQLRISNISDPILRSHFCSINFGRTVAEPYVQVQERKVCMISFACTNHLPLYLKHQMPHERMIRQGYVGKEIPDFQTWLHKYFRKATQACNQDSQVSAGQTSFPIFGLLPISLSYPWGSSQPVRNLPGQTQPLDKLDSAIPHPTADPPGSPLQTSWTKQTEAWTRRRGDAFLVSGFKSIH